MKARFFLENEGEVPLHTFEGWKRRGKVVRRGEKGLETRLWKRKNPKKDQNDEESVSQEEMNNEYFLAKAYLFSRNQVENLKK